MPVRRNSSNSKRPRRVEGDGTPLADVTLLDIFAGLPELVDVVRCAATCRRWRRLVSGEAAFLCRRGTTRELGNGGRFPSSLALGFFHHLDDDDDDYADGPPPPRFIATASAARRFGLRHHATPLSSLVNDDDGLLLDGRPSRVVASRNGLVVVDLRHGNKRDRTVQLCVCNPVNGDMHALPPLTGKDGVGQYACTLITAADLDTTSTSSYFRVVMVYRRRGFTAFRSYSSLDSGDGEWSEEAKVTGARLVGRDKMSCIRNAVVTRGGRAAYWLANDVVFGLRLDTLEAATADLSWPEVDTGKVVLGTTPHGRLCAVRLGVRRRMSGVGKWEYTLRIRSFDNNDRDGGDNGNDDGVKLQMGRLLRDTRTEVWVGRYLLDNDVDVKLRWCCEKTGVVFFSVAEWSYSDDRRYHMYAFSLGDKTVEKVASYRGWRDPWRNVHGYEINDQTAYLASLAEPDVANVLPRIDDDHPFCASSVVLP